MAVDTTGYHAGQGWFFKRGEDGEVLVRIGHSMTIASIEMSKETWASIVAAVSDFGETDEAISYAEDLHAGMTP